MGMLVTQLLWIESEGKAIIVESKKPMTIHAKMEILYSGEQRNVFTLILANLIEAS